MPRIRFSNNSQQPCKWFVVIRGKTVTTKSGVLAATQLIEVDDKDVHWAGWDMQDTQYQYTAIGASSGYSMQSVVADKVPKKIG